MSGETTLGGFLMQKWMEEDDDDFNLVIIDDRRKLIKQQMRERIDGTTPIRHDDFGNAYYDDVTLAAIWADVTRSSED